MNLKEKLSNGILVIGSWINSGSPIIAELMSFLGFDFLVIDVEHSAVDLPQAQILMQAIKSGNEKCFPIVRVHSTKYAIIKRYLDAGAKGIIAPLVNTEQQSMELVRGAKYFQEGMRGVGFCRANQYGVNIEEYLKKSNEETFLCVQIEHIDAVKNIDSILSVDGIDAALIGPYDLSASMGIAAQFEHPDYIKVRKSILEACKKHNIAPGIHVVNPNPEEVLKRVKEGFTFIGYSLDITIISTYLKSDLEKIKKLIGGLR